MALLTDNKAIGRLQAFCREHWQRALRVCPDLILLPVYLLSYRYRNKLYRFLMNGQTGKVAGSKPLSPWRIMLTIGGVLAAILVFLLLAGLLGGIR